MTAQQVCTFIIRRWIDECAPDDIARDLRLFGVTFSKSDVLYVIRRFIAECTENNTITRKGRQ